MLLKKRKERRGSKKMKKKNLEYDSTGLALYPLGISVNAWRSLRRQVKQQRSAWKGLTLFYYDNEDESEDYYPFVLRKSRRRGKCFVSKLCAWGKPFQFTYSECDEDESQDPSYALHDVQCNVPRVARNPFL